MMFFITDFKVYIKIATKSKMQNIMIMQTSNQLITLITSSPPHEPLHQNNPTSTMLKLVPIRIFIMINCIKILKYKL